MELPHINLHQVISPLSPVENQNLCEAVANPPATISPSTAFTNSTLSQIISANVVPVPDCLADTLDLVT